MEIARSAGVEEGMELVLIHVVTLVALVDTSAASRDLFGGSSAAVARRPSFGLGFRLGAGLAVWFVDSFL